LLLRKDSAPWRKHARTHAILFRVLHLLLDQLPLSRKTLYYSGSIYSMYYRPLIGLLGAADALSTICQSTRRNVTEHSTTSTEGTKNFTDVDLFARKLQTTWHRLYQTQTIPDRDCTKYRVFQTRTVPETALDTECTRYRRHQIQTALDTECTRYRVYQIQTALHTESTRYRLH
jgi:hypothetical protein